LRGSLAGQLRAPVISGTFPPRIRGAVLRASNLWGNFKGWGRAADRDVNTVAGSLRAIAKGRFNYEF